MSRRGVESPVRVKANSPTHDWNETHPAYACIGASRRSGGAGDLFASKVKHQHTVAITVCAATKAGDAYSERVHGHGTPIIEVEMTEAQWVSMVSRMNGPDVPCTMRYKRTGPLEEVPGIPPPVVNAERMTAMTDAMAAKWRQDIAKRAAIVSALLESLPVRKRDEAQKELGLLTSLLESNTRYSHEVLTEHKEKLTVEAAIEIEAMAQAMVTRLGLESVQQLGQILSANPGEALKLLAKDKTP